MDQATSARIKAFYGTSPNTVRTQVWSAIAVYLFVAILKKRLHLNASHYTILQILSLTLFEKLPIPQALPNFHSLPQRPMPQIINVHWASKRDRSEKHM
jgi:hypothetical protein